MTTPDATIHDAAADLARRLNSNPGGDSLAYARHLGDGVLDAGDTLRKRRGCDPGEIRVLVEADVWGKLTACVVTLWYRDGEPAADEMHAEGLDLDDVTGLRAAIDAAVGAP